jgi:glycosyltransferase involved in cell wall biosynthesis
MNPKTSPDTVSIILPAYNEEQTLGATLAAVRSIPGVTEIVVVDDGSLDRTAEIASAAGAAVLKNERNLGKGGSMERGLRHSSGDIVVFLDADLGASAAEAGKLIQAVREGACDMAIAQFYGGKQRKGGFGIVLGTARAGLKWKTGQEFRSPISGQRAFRRQAALDLCPIPGGFGAEVGLTIRAHRHGYRIHEVPTDMRNKATGRTLKGFIHRGKQFVHILKTFLTEPAR